MVKICYENTALHSGKRKKTTPCYIWRLRRNYVGIIQSSSWVLKKNWKKQELNTHLRYVSEVPGLPWSGCTPFLVSSSPCSFLSAACCAALVEDVLAGCLHFWIFLCVHFLLTGGGEEKRGVEGQDVKNTELWSCCGTISCTQDFWCLGDFPCTF